MARATGHVPHNPHEPLTEAVWDELALAYPNPGRIRIALELALDAQAFTDLVAGKPVDPARIDRTELEKAKQPRLVQLVRPIDVLQIAV